MWTTYDWVSVIPKINCIDAYLRLRLVAQDLVNLLDDLRSQFGNDLECLQVVENLLGFRRAQDDCAGAGIPRNPCQSKLGGVAAELCSAQDTQSATIRSGTDE